MNIIKNNWAFSILIFVFIAVVGFSNIGVDEVDAGATKNCGSCYSCSESDEKPSHHCHKCVYVCNSGGSYGGDGSGWSGPKYNQGAANALSGNENHRSDGRDAHGNMDSWNSTGHLQIVGGSGSCSGYSGGNAAMGAISSR